MVVRFRLSILTAVVLASAAGVSASATSQATDARPALEGTWVTTPISPRDVEAALRRGGLKVWIADFRPDSPIRTATTLTLRIRKGKWDLFGTARGHAREPIDYNARYVVRGNTVDKIHGTGTTTLRWKVSGRTLRLTWLGTSEPPVNGIPDQIYQHALYMTRPFTRGN